MDQSHYPEWSLVFYDIHTNINLVSVYLPNFLRDGKLGDVRHLFFCSPL